MSKKLLLDSLPRALLVVFAFALSIQAVPSTISYQGQLLNNAGEPVADGTYQVIFTIYDANVGGNSKWSETQSVSTNNGLFNVKLGAINPIADSVFDGDPRFLGIIINSDPELTPRTELQPVPYSYTAKDAEKFGGMDVSKFAQRESSNTFSEQNYFQNTTHHQSSINLYNSPLNIYRGIGTRWIIEEGDTYGLRFRQYYDDADFLQNRTVLEIGDDGNIHGPGARFTDGALYVDVIADSLGIYGEVDGIGKHAIYGRNNYYNTVGYVGGYLYGAYGKGGSAGVQGVSSNGLTLGSLGSTTAAVHGVSYDGSAYAGYFAGKGYFSDDVGIGVSANKGYRLDVYKSASDDGDFDAMRVSNAGYGGAISASCFDGWTVYASNRLDVGGGVYTNQTVGQLCNDSIGVFGHNIANNNLGYIGGDSAAIFGQAGSGSDYAGLFDGKVYIISNLGIGSSSPTAQLDITGGTPFVHINTTNTTAGMRFRKNNSNKWSMAWNEGSAYLYFYSYSGGGTTMVIRDADGYVGIGSATPSERLTVGGNICYTGSIGACSDYRFKTETGNLDDALGNVLKMRPIKYRWKQDDFPDRNFDDREHIGVIAQEIEKLYPQLVMTDKDGYKSVDYSRLTPVLIEAIKQQQKQIDELKKTVQRLAGESKTNENSQYGSK